MRWTVARRVTIGYAVVLLLLAVVSLTALYALFRTGEAFEDVIQRQQLLDDAMEARGDSDRAVVSLYRYLTTGDERFLEERALRGAEAREGLTKLQQASRSAERKKGWGQVQEAFDAWDEAAKAAVAAKRGGRAAEAHRITTDRVIPARDRIQPAIRSLVNDERAQTHAVAAATVSLASRTQWALLGLGVVALVVGAALAWGLTRSIVGPLRDSISTLASAASEILASTTQQASGTAEEATAVQETSATVDEVRQTAQVAAQKARAVTEEAQRTAQVSQDGQRAVEESVRGMQDTRARMEAIAERILALSEQGQAIAEIMASVNELAEQSNLLAVNAAIEAAKAGEAGRGFGVVATEVRSLAEQSKQATGQVRTILNEIQRATQAAVMAAEQGVKASDAGLATAARADEAIRLLAGSLTASAQAAQQILASAQQQATGLDQVGLAMHNIQQASTQNMASTRQMERAAQDLNELAGRLKGLVASTGNARG